MTKDRNSPAWGWKIAWTLVFASNLIVPLMLGWGICGTGGRVGLVLAVAACWGLGLGAFAVRARLGQALVCGGVLVALSQFWPWAQVCSGMVALRAWSVISGEPGAPPSVLEGWNGRPLSGVGGFAVTSMTGGLLMAAALACGLAIVGVHVFISIGKPDYDPRDEL